MVTGRLTEAGQGEGVVLTASELEYEMSLEEIDPDEKAYWPALNPPECKKPTFHQISKARRNEIHSIM
jgi:hypothetical protein